MTFNWKHIFVNDLPILSESSKWSVAEYTDKYSLNKKFSVNCPFVLCFGLYLMVAQRESLWWRQFLVSSEVILPYCMLDALFQEPFLYFSHSGIFPLTLAAVMLSTGRNSEEQGRNVHVLSFIKGSRKNTLVSPTSPNLAPIKEDIKCAFILGPWDVQCREGRKGPGYIQRTSFPTDLLWAEGYVAERCSAFPPEWSTLYANRHNVIQLHCPYLFFSASICLFVWSSCSIL